MNQQPLQGLLRLHVLRGRNLINTDSGASDPYVVVTLDKQKLRTKVKSDNINPEWNEDLTLCVSDPTQPIKLEVFDKDTFTRDDKMGEAKIDIQPFIDTVKNDWDGLRDGTVITTVKPTSENCLARESDIFWKNGQVIQDVVLRLQNVQSGEVELQLIWISLPSGAGF